MKKISIILLFLTAVCPLAQAQRVKVYVTDAWDKPLGEVAVTLGRGRTPWRLRAPTAWPRSMPGRVTA